MKVIKRSCAIAQSISFLGDKWSLLVLRDIILHNKSKFKDFRESREKIATNILSDRLKKLTENGFIEILDPLGTKKSRQYIATDAGIRALPIIIELYLFSINYIDESLLDVEQKKVKREILSDSKLFKKIKLAEYLAFRQGLKNS